MLRMVWPNPALPTSAPQQARGEARCGGDDGRGQGFGHVGGGLSVGVGVVRRSLRGGKVRVSGAHDALSEP